VFPKGARLIPNPYNKIPGFYIAGDVPSGAGPSQAASAPSGGSDRHAVGERGGVYFVPGFPVLAWPMIEWVLDQHYMHLFCARAYTEKSVIVFGSMEATLTPLMEEIERTHPGVKIFSLPSVDHPEYGRHIDLGVKGTPDAVEPAYARLLAGLASLGVRLGPELVR
jgi:molybdopterin-biosynthesis enzyme MoeA-like protein